MFLNRASALLGHRAPLLRPSHRLLCSTSTDAATIPRNNKPKAVFLNAARLNYDGKLDFSSWQSLVDLHLHPVDRVSNVDDILSLIGRDTEIVLTKEMNLPEAAIQAFPSSVKLLCECGTGYNNIPVNIAHQMGITVCNVPEYSTHAVAHTAITFLLNFSANIYQQTIMLKCENDRRNFTSPFTLPLNEVNGKVLGLVGGSGRIGTQVAMIALALGMHVIIGRRPNSGRNSLPASHALTPYLEDTNAFTPGKVSCTNDLHGTLLPNADYVSIHTPLNEHTRHSFGRTELNRMKRTAYLINTSRGAIINEQDLIEVLLDGGVIAGAGLDVTETEPPAEDSPLYDLPNVQLSPHTGWRRLETRQRLISYTADTLYAYVNAKTPKDYKNVVVP